MASSLETTLYEQIKAAPEITFEDAIRAAKSGTFMEFGVHTGGTINIIASLTKNTVYGFDSFEGLPEAWNNLDVGAFKCGVPDVLDNVKLVVGLFQDTLIDFLVQDIVEPITFVHIDCDLYSSTKFVLDAINLSAADGCIVAFDEIIDYDGDNWLKHEYKAFEEFLYETGATAECIGRYGTHQAAFRLTF